MAPCATGRAGRRRARSHSLRAANALVGNRPMPAPGDGLSRAHPDGGRATCVCHRRRGGATILRMLAARAAPARGEEMRSSDCAKASLRIGALTGGAVLYIAVEGGFAIEPMPGQLVDICAAASGGSQGRPRIQGDRLPLNRAAASEREDAALEDLTCPCPKLRTIVARKVDQFSPDEVTAFFQTEYSGREPRTAWDAPAGRRSTICRP